jgi:hypothetical protein
MLSSLKAQADNNSLLTAGFGAALGTQQSFDYESSAFVEGKVRLRALRGLGLEASYNPLVLKQDGPIYDSPLKVFGLVHIVPTTPVGAYFKFGVGASSPRTLFMDDPSASYHIGLGMNFYWAKNLAVGCEGLMSLPNFGSMREDFDSEHRRYKFSADIFYYL